MSKASAAWFRSSAVAGQLLPGVLLSVAVTATAVVLERVEVMLFGRVWLEALVLAIVLGILVRTITPPARRFLPGIVFSGSTLLEVAIVLLGASISAAVIAAAGALAVLGIAGLVLVSILLSYSAARLLGLGHQSATLVACGNSICGNSAIAAVSPVIGASPGQTASAIAFTAVLGVIMVLVMPAAAPVIGLSDGQYGFFAGLTVYAVPQDIAATAPVSALSMQMGTLVKLIRVLMLGPVIVAIAVFGSNATGVRPPLHRLLPWFIVGFLAMMAVRSLGLVPQPVLGPMAATSASLTTISMAALGLGVDIRSMGRVGVRVTAASAVSIAMLCGLAYGLVIALRVA
jgi:uncharacterized integral membrane protein (TIGR00698 family)